MNPFFFLVFVFTLSFSLNAQAAISWDENILAGSTEVKASHINELRTQIQALRTDVDSGGVSGDLNVESITVTDGEGIMWENGINKITHNDGGGNVQIRFGHDYSSSDERFTQAGGSAFYIGGALDSSKSALEMKVGTNASPADNDAVSWGPTFAVNTVGISTGGTITASGNILANGTTYEGDGKTIVQYSDSWLRLNPSNEFTSGTYVPGLLATNNSLGVGTTSPSQKIHTTGNIRADGRHIYLGSGQDIYGDNGSLLYYDSNDSNTTQMVFRDKENAVYGRIYGSGNGSDFGLLDGDGNWGMQMKKDVHTGFLVNNSEKMRILANGRVGIGTTSPSSSLHVKDASWTTLTVEATVDGTDPTLNLVNNVDGSSSWTMRMDESDADKFQVRYNNSQFFTIKTNGNIGIGTTNPAQKLDVNGYARINSGGDYTFLNLGKQGYDQLYADNSASKSYGGGVWFRVANSAGTGYTDSLRIAENGYVGIGTNPNEKLEVAGDIRMSGSGWKMLEMDGSASTRTLRMHYGGDTSNELRFGRYADNFSNTWQANPIKFDMDAPDSSFV